jgi:hypothetical protein
LVTSSISHIPWHLSIPHDEKMHESRRFSLRHASAPEAEILTLLALLDRLCAMLTRLAHMGEPPSGPAQTGQRGR